MKHFATEACYKRKSEPFQSFLHRVMSTSLSVCARNVQVFVKACKRVNVTM